jgi:hypothetical protein
MLRGIGDWNTVFQLGGVKMKPRWKWFWPLLALVALACGGLALMVQSALRGLGEFIPPTCQVTLSDEQVMTRQDAILSLPAIKQLTQEVSNIQFRLGNCAVNDQLHGFLDFTLPSSYSRFGAIYRPIIDFHLTWNDLDTLTLIWDRAPMPLDYVTMTGIFREKILEYESAPEIQEYLTYQETVPTILYVRQISYSNNGIPGSGIGYSLDKRQVTSYNLPSSIQWKSFPEIEQAHQIIRQHLFTGKLAQCQIGMDGLFSHTARNEIYDQNGYRMRVDLQCPDKVREAGLELYPDGHFEKLEIIWEGG